MEELPRFRREFKLWKACDKDNKMRPVLEYIVFDNGYAYATNTHILAKVKLEALTMLDPDEAKKLNGFCIHSDAYKVLVGHPIEEITNDGIPSVVCRIKSNTFSFALYPNSKINPPKYEDIIKADGECHPIEKIGIEQKLLSDLTDSIGYSRVKMDFYSESSKIIVTPIDADYLDVKGLIMPIMTTGSLKFD